MGLRRLLWCWLVLVFLCGGARGQTARWDWEPTPAVDTANGIAGLISIPVGGWQWHIGEEPACGPYPSAGCPVGSNYETTLQPLALWLWREVTLTPEMLRAPELAFLLNDGFPVYEIFVNGQSIGRNGTLATGQGPLYGRHIFLFPQGLVRDGKVMLAVHVLLPRFGESGTNELSLLGLPAAVDLGKRAGTLDEFRRNWPHFLAFGLVVCAGLLFLVLFALERESREYLWLGLLLLGYGLLRASELGTIVNLHLSVLTTRLWWIPLQGSLVVLKIEFVFALLHRRVRWPFRVVEALAALGVLNLVLVLPLSTMQIAPLMGGLQVLARLFNLLAGVGALVPLWPLRACWRSRDPEMKWIGGALIFLVFEELNRYLKPLGTFVIAQDWVVGGVDIDLRALAFLLFSLVMLVAMMVRFRRVRGRNRVMVKEFEAAKVVQDVLIPQELPAIAGLTIESAYLPAQEVGGDFFQVLPLADGAALVVVGDVSGKGLPAAMTVALLVGALGTLVETVTAPGEVLAGLNRRLVGRGDGFATCLALRIEPDGAVTVANAGHPSPYLLGAEVATEAGLPLGLAAEMGYEETRFRLGVGERLTVVTDGVVEAASAKTRELFGFARTLAVSGKRAEEIAGEASRFGVGAEQADDITVVSVVRG